LKVLFITRKFPPLVGGMEMMSFQMYAHFLEMTEVKLIKWNKPNYTLPLGIVYLLIKSVISLMRKEFDVIYVHDALLSILVPILKIFKVPVVITAHGKDVTYNRISYQLVIPLCLKMCDLVICVSPSTRDACTERGIHRTVVVLNAAGVTQKPIQITRDAKKVVSKYLGEDLEESVLLVSLGRLVRRKGFGWFIESCMPRLNGDSVKYIVIGDGREMESLKEKVSANNLEDSVILSGFVDEYMKWAILYAADIFIMPNIHVDGDMEGFGISAVEAASCGKPVVASDLEGIKEALGHGKAGILLEPENSAEYITTIKELIDDPDECRRIGDSSRDYVFETYSWGRMAKEYLEHFWTVNHS
jgi:glycosyltransferase involved in cell wall biosynthesis